MAFKKKQSRGFALILALFLTVALATILTGSIMTMMRQGRLNEIEIQRAQMIQAADAVIYKLQELMKNYASSSLQGFPGFVNGSDYEVNGSDLVVGGAPINKPIGQYVKDDWFNHADSGFKYRFGLLDSVNAISISVKEIGHGATVRNYKATAQLKNSITNLQVKASNEFTIENGRLMDFSIFYNDNLEIGAGPDSEIQGPIFSNKRIFLMNDANSTMYLRVPDDFNSSDPVVRNKYVVRSADSIYFFLDRTFGENYLLGNSDYKNNYLPDPAQYPQLAALRNPPNNIETVSAPRYGGWSGLIPGPFPLPKPYYFANEVRWADDVTKNVIKVDVDKNNFVKLYHARYLSSPVHKGWQCCVSDFDDNLQYTYGSNGYIVGSADSGNMNHSTAVGGMNGPSIFDFNALFAYEMPLNPRWKITNGIPATMNDKNGLNGTNLPGVVPETIQLGDPANPSGPHLLIEPLTDIFPVGSAGTRAVVNDTNESKQAKFQCKASNTCDPSQSVGNLNLYRAYNQSGTLANSSDLDSLINDGVVTFPQFYDYRIGGALKVMQIDLEKLFQLRPGLIDKTGGLIIYAHTYPYPAADASLPSAVRIIKGYKVSRHGFTFATNGRLFLQDNFNIYDYSKERNCSEAEWDSKACVYPPAAFFSDSFVALSNQWSDGYVSGTSLNGRNVSSNRILNAAVVTGYIKSQLEKSTYGAECAADFSKCTFNGGADALEGMPCDAGLNTSGQPVDPAQCVYYKENGFYYINRNSDLWKWAVTATPTHQHPVPDPPADVKIPIFVHTGTLGEFYYLGHPNWTGLAPAKPLKAGLAYSILHVRPLFGQKVVTTCGATDQIMCNGTLCSAGADCINPGGEGAPYCGGCRGGGPIYSVTYKNEDSFDPSPLYSLRYQPLYRTRYSGGLENLINYQENWFGRSIRILGMFAAPWEAKELYINGQPKFWDKSYYSAPARIFDFNESLKSASPPGTPAVLSLKVGKWKVEKT